MINTRIIQTFLQHGEHHPAIYAWICIRCTFPQAVGPVLASADAVEDFARKPENPMIEGRLPLAELTGEALRPLRRW
jgi:hypothetical protein